MKKTKNTTWRQRFDSENTLKSAIRYIFKSAKKEQKSHNSILSDLQGLVYEKSKYTTLPNYMQCEINGYINANLDIMYQYLEFAHVYDGKHTVDLVYDENFDNALITESYYCYIGTNKKY